MDTGRGQAVPLEGINQLVSLLRHFENASRRGSTLTPQSWPAVAAGAEVHGARGLGFQQGWRPGHTIGVHGGLSSASTASPQCRCILYRLATLSPA